MSELEACCCIRCGGQVRVEKHVRPNAIVEAAIVCVGCAATYDYVWGVPVLGLYEQADFAALVEVAANAQQKSSLTPAGLDRWADILEGYHEASDREAFAATLGPGELPFLPNRYSEWSALQELIAGEVVKGRDVLDVGAGLGFDAYGLARAGALVTALEFSPVLAREGRNTLPMMRWIGGSSHLLPFADHSFDYVFANAALHHMTDVQAAMSEMLRVLRVGGKLVTTGDPFRADRLGEEAEVAIFNRHPDVLLGVNECVPRLGELTSALLAERAHIEPRIFTQTLYDAPELAGTGTLEEFREWNFDRDLAALRGASGSVAMKIKLVSPISATERRRISGRALRPALLASWLTSQSKAMAALSAWAPEDAVNRAFPGTVYSKFELLNGWQAPTKEHWRQAYRRGRWYLRRAASETRLSFEVRAPREAEFDVFLNSEKILRAPTLAGTWTKLEASVSTVTPGATFAVELMMVDPREAFDDGLFQVRRRRLHRERGFLLSRLRRRLIRQLDPQATFEPLGVVCHKAAAESGDYSFAGEASAIWALLIKLRLERGYAVDIAASDGVAQSCTLALFRDHGWSGLAVEHDSEKFAKLAYAYTAFPHVDLARCKVTPDCVAALLSAHGVNSRFEFLNMDIDSYDLFVVKALLEGGFRPRLISMEVNEKVPPPLYFTVLFDENHVWQEDHFFGCSVVAAAETVRSFGYVLADVSYNNALFVESDLAKEAGVADQDVAVAFARGYRDRPDRKKMFPWNTNVDAALAMRPEAALEFFREHFSAYEGKFELRFAGPGENRQ